MNKTLLAAGQRKAPAGYSRGNSSELPPFSQTIARLCSKEAK